jgi:hypothetical protein
MRVAFRVPKTGKGDEEITLFTNSVDNRHGLSRDQAYELARALIACADLMTEFEKRDPNTGKFRDQVTPNAAPRTKRPESRGRNDPKTRL